MVVEVLFFGGVGWGWGGGQLSIDDGICPRD